MFAFFAVLLSTKMNKNGNLCDKSSDFYQYLVDKLFSRHSVICKAFRLKVPTIHSETVEKPKYITWD